MFQAVRKHNILYKTHGDMYSTPVVLFSVKLLCEEYSNILTKGINKIFHLVLA